MTKVDYGKLYSEFDSETPDGPHTLGWLQYDFVFQGIVSGTPAKYVTLTWTATSNSVDFEDLAGETYLFFDGDGLLLGGPPAGSPTPTGPG